MFFVRCQATYDHRCPCISTTAHITCYNWQLNLIDLRTKTFCEKDRCTDQTNHATVARYVCCVQTFLWCDCLVQFLFSPAWIVPHQNFRNPCLIWNKVSTTTDNKNTTFLTTGKLSRHPTAKDIQTKFNCSLQLIYYTEVNTTRRGNVWGHLRRERGPQQVPPQAHVYETLSPPRTAPYPPIGSSRGRNDRSINRPVILLARPADWSERANSDLPSSWFQGQSGVLPRKSPQGCLFSTTRILLTCVTGRNARQTHCSLFPRLGESQFGRVPLPVTTCFLATTSPFHQRWYSSVMTFSSRPSRAGLYSFGLGI